MQDTANQETRNQETDMSVMTHPEMMATPHFSMANGWKVVAATGHVWKWSIRRNRWENWR